MLTTEMGLCITRKCRHSSVSGTGWSSGTPDPTITLGLRIPRSLLVCLVLTTAAAGGCRSAPETVAPPPPAVVVATPLVIRMTEWDEYTGRFEATDRVDVRARVDGYLNSIHFRDGALVKQGDLLFVIDPRPYEAVLEGSRADVVRAETRVELATTDFTRGETLFAIRGISQEEFDRRTQGKKEAEAALIVARAAERTAALNVEFTRVRAPMSGRISEKFVSVGNLVSGGQAGSTLLTTIVAVDPIRFVFDASEADYLKYNRLNASGERPSSRDAPNPVRIRLLDETTFRHVGKMDFVDNRLDPTTGTMRGRALVPNPGGFLTPGQFGRVQLIGSGEFDALLVPDSAILSDQSRRFVWTIGNNDIAEQRVIEPGNLERGLRIVRAGLQRADRVVINGMQRVRPGTKVTPTAGHIEPLGSS
jgi:RND family efflux transporter MFP subunit